MKTLSSAEFVVREFVAAINAHDSRAIIARCTNDHLFVDSLGNHLSGEGKLEQAWQWYFAVFPDYRIDVESLAVADDCVLLSGWACATHFKSGAAWRIPAAWRAVVAGEHIAHWQVYTDNKPVYEILSRDA